MVRLSRTHGHWLRDYIVSPRVLRSPADSPDRAQTQASIGQQHQCDGRDCLREHRQSVGGPGKA